MWGATKIGLLHCLSRVVGSCFFNTLLQHLLHRKDSERRTVHSWSVPSKCPLSRTQTSKKTTESTNRACCPPISLSPHCSQDILSTITTIHLLPSPRSSKIPFSPKNNSKKKKRFKHEVFHFHPQCRRCPDGLHLPSASRRLTCRGYSSRHSAPV